MTFNIDEHKSLLLHCRFKRQSEREQKRQTEPGDMRKRADATKARLRAWTYKEILDL